MIGDLDKSTCVANLWRAHLRFEIYTLKSWHIIENSNKMMKVKTKRRLFKKNIIPLFFRWHILVMSQGEEFSSIFGITVNSDVEVQLVFLHISLALIATLFCLEGCFVNIVWNTNQDLFLTRLAAHELRARSNIEETVDWHKHYLDHWLTDSRTNWLTHWTTDWVTRVTAAF